MNLDIFILCHNRPKHAQEAIQSILAQNSHQYRLIISDNSSNSEVQKMVETHFPLIEYRRRPSDLPALSHFNTCISEARANYFCLFHDDDIMFENFISEVQKNITKNPEAVAIGTNACVRYNVHAIRELSFLSFGPIEKISNPTNLFRRYFGRYHTGIAPFPGYVYKTIAIGKTRIPENGGKYADVSWLLTIASAGEIFWIAKPLFEYRIHGGNDGLQESLDDRLRFLSFLKKNKKLCNDTGLADYRYFLYKKLIVSYSADRFSNRMKSLKKYIHRHRITRLLRGKDYFFMVKCAILKHLLRPKDCQ